MAHDETRAAGAFPADFVWGVATAAYQIEGGATEDGRGESIWDRFSHTPGKVANGDTGDVACDHYHRYAGDVSLVRELGFKAYRFSVAWPRVLPAGRGRVNPSGLVFYDRLVDGLLEAGITPWVTLYHWDLPQVLQDQGGWTNRATADAFAEYVDAVTRRLGDRVTRWITLNEPWCSSFLSYWIGEHAPGHHSLQEAIDATHTLLLAHGRSVPIIRRNSPNAQVGITLNLAQVYPASQSEADRAAAERYAGYFNRWFLDPLYGRGYPADLLDLYGADLAPRVEPGDLDVIAVPTDFLGLNYYSPTFIAEDPENRPFRARDAGLDGAERTEMGWIVHPQGLYDLMADVSRAYPTGPLYITENGAAYPDPEPREGRVADPSRLAYYQGHLAAALRATRDGIPLRGYFAWSLMDNFEWAFGYTRRFGITYVDYATQQRTVKDSGRWLSKVARENGI